MFLGVLSVALRESFNTTLRGRNSTKPIHINLTVLYSYTAC